jgi:hypothetical protein
MGENARENGKSAPLNHDGTQHGRGNDPKENRPEPEGCACLDEQGDLGDRESQDRKSQGKFDGKYHAPATTLVYLI